MKKILFLYTDWSLNEYRIKHNQYGGVSYYRIIEPANNLKYKYNITVKGAQVKKESKGKDSTKYFYDLISKFDMVITKHVDDPLTASTICFCCEQLKVPLVVDLDDDLFNIRPDQPAYKYYHPGSQSRAIFSAYISYASALFVSTEPLKKVYGEYLKKVFNIEKPIYVLPNCNNKQEFDYKLPKKDQNKVLLGYAGSITHDRDLKIILPILERIMYQKKNVHIDIFGAMNSEAAIRVFGTWDKSLLDRVGLQAGTYAWDKYPKLLMKQPYDIGLAPLFNDTFNIGKSHIKWMEYAMLGIPTIASKTYPYYKDIGKLKTIQDGNTGILVKDEKEWEKQLLYLIENKEYRERIGKNAKEYVETNWQYKDNIYLWEEAIEDIFKKCYN